VSGPDPFEERLALLEQSGQVTPTARELTLEVIAGIADRLRLTIDEERGAGLVTHLAMALARVERGEPETTLIDGLADEIADRTRERAVVAELLDACGRRLGREVPVAEVDYVTLHVCALAEDPEL
jgi:transcriptional regulatory protein LevR